MPLIGLLNPPLGLTGLTTGFNGLTIPLIPIDWFEFLTTITTKEGWEITTHSRTPCKRGYDALSTFTHNNYVVSYISQDVPQ